MARLRVSAAVQLLLDYHAGSTVGFIDLDRVQGGPP